MDVCSLRIPQGEMIIKSTKLGSSTALLVAGGRKPADTWLLSAAEGKDIYCADKGIESCLQNGLKPVLLCGDADSTEAFYWQQAQKEGIKIMLHDPAKDDTDLQLLLEVLPSATNIIASGIWGGRFDHLYSNVFSLLAYKEKQNVQVVMADEQESLVLLSSGESLIFSPDCAENIEALSLLPLNSLNKVTLQGVQWDLKYSPLLLNHPYAISNMIKQETVFFTCDEGTVGFYLKHKI